LICTDLGSTKIKSTLSHKKDPRRTCNWL